MGFTTLWGWGRGGAARALGPAIKQMEAAVKDPWCLLEEGRGFTMPRLPLGIEYSEYRDRTITGKLPWL